MLAYLGFAQGRRFFSGTSMASVVFCPWWRAKSTHFSALFTPSS